MQKKQYTVVFEGKLLEGFDKETILENLSRLYKRDAAGIEKGLFTGKPVVVKKTDSKEEAERFQRGYRNAGVEVVIKEVLATGKPESQKKRKLWPAITAAIVLTMVSLAGGAYWYVDTKVLNGAVPETVLAAEEALASDNLVALVHVNVAKAVDVEKKFIGAEDNGALASSGSDSFLDKLAASGIKPREQLEQFLLALHMGAKDSSYYSAILLGNFNKNAIIEFLKKEYIVEETFAGKEPVLIFTKQKVDDCSFSQKKSIHVSNNRILITSPDYMETLLGRLNQAPADKIDLTAWRKYRSRHIASSALFATQHTEKMADGIMAMALTGLKKEIEPVHSGFAGISAQLVPPAIKFDLCLNSKDRNWINATSAKWKQKLDDTRKKAGNNLPSMAKLFNPLTIEHTEEQLRAELLLSRDFQQNISEVFREAFSSVLSVKVSNNVDTSTEKIDENPTPFFAKYPESMLKPFDSALDTFYVPDLTTGPFGIRVEAVRVTDNNEVEIVLEARGHEIENLGKTGRVSLAVTSIKDSSGNELLKEEKCGKERNSEPAMLNTDKELDKYNNGRWEKHRKAEGKKSVRLKEGLSLEEIALLEGVIRLNLPVQTETEIIMAPFADQVVERQNLRLRFNEGSPNELSYSVSGDESLLIAVRGLNKDKKHLEGLGSSSFSRFFGQGKSISSSFQGQVEYAEIIVAKNVKELKYPFTLNSVYPAQKKGSILAAIEAETYSLKRFDREFSKARPSRKRDENNWLGEVENSLILSPFLIELYKVNIGGFGGCSGTVEVISPVIPSLAKSHMALELKITEAVTAAEESVPANFSDFIHLKQDGYYSNGQFIPDEKKNYLEGQAYFRFPYDKETLKALKGSLVLRLPKKTKKIIMEQARLGTSVTDSNFAMNVKEISTGRIKLAVKGDRSRIIGFNIFNDENAIISEYPHLEMKGDVCSVTLGSNGIPDRIEMIVAEEVESREFPFSLAVNK